MFPGFTRVRGLVFLGGFYDALRFLRAFGPHGGDSRCCGNVARQELLKFSFGVVHALRQVLLAKDAEETFHHLDPGSMGWRVVKVHLRMALQPESAASFL